VREVVITCVLLLTSATVHADPASDEAQRLFEEGRALGKANKWVDACDRFTKSLALVRTSGTEINLADCNERLGHLREAWGMFVVAASDSEAEGNTARADLAREHAAALEPKMTAITVKVAQPDLPGLAITIAGRAASPAAEIHEHTDPGPIDVIATAPNLQHFKRTEIGAAGATVVVEIPPLDPNRVEQHPFVPPKDTVIEGAGDRDAGRVHLAYGFGVGALVAGGAAVTLTVVGYNHYHDVKPPDCIPVPGGISCPTATGKAKIHDAQQLANYGTVCAIGGAALAGVAIALFVTAPRGALHVTPTATATSTGISLSGSF
jgi:serine/threonine-protein kinase